MTLAEAPVLGKDCHLYYNSATHASPTWVEIKKAINVKYKIGKGEAEVTSRETSWKLTKGGLKELEVTFNYRKKQGTDTVFAFLQAKAISGDAAEFWVADGPQAEVGVQGPRAFCEVISLDGSQELENAEEVEFALKPTYHEETNVLVEPDWHTVPAGP
jgi:hypothetical protein